MKENYLSILEKNAKRCFKGKIKITLSLIVSLMINGVAFGVDDPLLPDENREINFENTKAYSSDTGYGFKVIDYYGLQEEPLMEKVSINIVNSNDLDVTNIAGGESSGIYIPGTDKFTEFYQSDENSKFTVTNNNKIKVDGSSAYGIHVKFSPLAVSDVKSMDSSTVSKGSKDTDDSEEEDDPLYAYPDININNNKSDKDTDGIYVLGEVNAQGVTLDTPFSNVSIDNAGVIDSQISGKINSEKSQKVAFGGATGINIFIEEEEEAPSNDKPDWITETSKKGNSEEDEISPIPMNIAVNNSGKIKSMVTDKSIARILGINIGQYDDHTLTQDTELADSPKKMEILTSLVEQESKSVSLLSESDLAVTSKKGKGSGSGSGSGNGGCGGKPKDALVFNNVTNSGDIEIVGDNLSAVQAVGINSRMSEGTQSTFVNSETGNININVKIKNAHQTNVEEDPTSGNLYGINVFNSGRPSRVNINNNGDIYLSGIIEDSNEDNEKAVGIQGFGIKSKARGRDSVSDTNNTSNIYVESFEEQNDDSMDYTYYTDTEGKEIFGARAVGIYGTTAGRGAYTEVTNGSYDMDVDETAMDRKRDGETVSVYDEVQEAIKNVYEDNLNEHDTFLGEIDTRINTVAASNYGYAQAKGIWSTSEAIENSQFVYNSENSSIKAQAVSPERGAEAFGIEGESYQNVTVNKGLIEVDSKGKIGTGIGILAEVSEIEEEEMNEHAKKPEFVGADVGMPFNLPGKKSGKDKKVDNTTYESSEVLTLKATTYESSEVSTLKSDSALKSDSGNSGSKEEGSEKGESKKPEMGIKNKYILNTGKINVNVNEGIESNFAFGAGIESSRIVLELIKGDRVNDFKVSPVYTLKSASLEDYSSDVDGVGGATDTSEGTNGGSSDTHGEPEQSLNQNIVNNGLIEVAASGNTAIASGISSLTKVEVLFDSDSDGVSDAIDEKPLDPNFSSDLDKDGIDDKLDKDADGDGFISVAFGGNDYFDTDSDNDGVSNRQDNDDDGDGILDENDNYLDPVGENQNNGYEPISEAEYIKLTDTSGGMPENLIETSGIVEAEEVVINNNFTNNGALNVTALSESPGGISIANGIATDVAWSELQKPVYEAPIVDDKVLVNILEEVEVEVGEIEEDTIEKNYDNFVNTGDIQVKSQSDQGIALAFGIRDGNYYSIDEAISERTPITKKYVGTMLEDEETVGNYGIVNKGNITVAASGSETKAFGIMSGYLNEDNNSNEEFVISTIKNEGNIRIDYEDNLNNSVDSIGAGIVAFADQQIEFLPKVNENGVLLAESDDTEDVKVVEQQPSFEDYAVKDPEKATLIINNQGNIQVNSNKLGGNYGIYAGINPVEEVDEEKLAGEMIQLRKINLNEDGLVLDSKEIFAETQNGEESKQIGTLYTVTYEGEEYQFVTHAAENKGEGIPDSIYIVDKDGGLTPKVSEVYKIGETELEVINSGEINVTKTSGIGIYLGSQGIVENSGTIIANKAIVTSEYNDTVDLKDGSKIYGDIETEDGDDLVYMSEHTKIEGNINLGDGDDELAITNGNIIGNGKDVYVIDGGSRQ